MAELGLTRDRLANGFGPMNTFSGRRIRYFKSKGITPNPAAYDLIGWAMGFAAASGRQKPNPEDWLLSIIYRNNGMVGSVQHGLGVSSAAIIDALRRRGGQGPGLRARRVPTLARPPHRGGHVATSSGGYRRAQRVAPGRLRMAMGINSRKNRPGKVQFSAEDGIELKAIVAATLSSKSQLGA
jgi:hypothetical protein